MEIKNESVKITTALNIYYCFNEILWNNQFITASLRSKLTGFKWLVFLKNFKTIEYLFFEGGILWRVSLEQLGIEFAREWNMRSYWRADGPSIKCHSFSWWQKLPFNRNSRHISLLRSGRLEERVCNFIFDSLPNSKPVEVEEWHCITKTMFRTTRKKNTSGKIGKAMFDGWRGRRTLWKFMVWQRIEESFSTEERIFESGWYLTCISWKVIMLIIKTEVIEPQLSLDSNDHDATSTTFSESSSSSFEEIHWTLQMFVYLWEKEDSEVWTY